MLQFPFAFTKAKNAGFGEGTDWVNHHPIVVLFLSKLCSLNGGYYECQFKEAWEACEKLAGAMEVKS